MSLGLALVAILIVAVAAGWFGFARASRLRIANKLHSLPSYHGAYAALWAAIPALLLIAAWAPMQSRMVDQAVLASPEGKALPNFDMQRESILSAGWSPVSLGPLILRTETAAIAGLSAVQAAFLRSGNGG